MRETSAILRVRSETDLVISDDVNGAINSKFREFAEGQSFIGSSLASESCISMPLNIEDFLPIAVQVFLLGFSLTHRHTVL